MQKAYERINWENDLTPLNEDNLNLMDAALNELDNRIISIDTAKLGKTEASSMLTNFALNTETGVITLTYYDGSKQTINTNLAKIALNISYDATNERLVLTMPDGSVTYVDMSALITQYEFVESDVAYFTVTSDGKVKVEIKDHSITADKLQPNFLADVQTASNSASKSASSALNSANSASVSEVNAKESEEKAKMYAENASAVTGVQIATEEIAGLVKGGDNHIAEDGTLTLTARTDSGVLEHSHAGGIRLHSITAVEDRQDGVPSPGELAVLSNNQLKVTMTEVTEGGITATANDGKVLVFGDATADVQFTVGSVALKAGTYYAYNDCIDNGEVSSDGSYTVYIYEEDNLVDTIAHLDSVGETSFALTEDKTVVYVIEIISGNYINSTFKPMIAKSSGATWDVYEEGYTEGYPQPIEATSMKNLLKHTLTSFTSSGVAFTVNEDKSISIKGTAQTLITITLSNMSLNTGKYILSGGRSVYCYIDIIYKGNQIQSQNTDVAFAVTDSSNLTVRIVIPSGETVDTTFYPMIRPASILDDTYVPYGCMRVVGKGKNLCGKLTKGKVLMYNTGTVVDGANYFCSDFVQVEYGKSYVISNASAGSENWYYDKNKKAIKSMGIDAASSYVRKITITNEDYAYIRCSGYLSMIDGFMIEEGTEKTDYTPYVEQSTILSKQFADFHNINGVSDGLTPYNEVRRFATVVFDGSDDEGWAASLAESGAYRLYTSALKSKVKPASSMNISVNILCSHFKRVTASGTYASIPGIAIDIYGNLYAYDENFNTNDVSLWKTYLAEHPMTVVYELAAEQTTPLSTTDKIALHNLKSFDGVTHLYTDTFPPMVIDCEYGTSKVGALTFDALNKADANEIRYNELASALLALNQE